VKEIVLAVLGVLGVAIPSVLQLVTGESRRVSNMKATLELLKDLPEESDFDDTRTWLRNALRGEAHLDRVVPHKRYMLRGLGVFAVCLVFSYLVMQPPGSGQTESELRSLFILLAVASYAVGLAIFLHGVHLLGRHLHMFSGAGSQSS
jgi:hypothetical protein